MSEDVWLDMLAGCREQLTATARERDALIARVKELEAGLRPFAAVAALDIGSCDADGDRFKPMHGRNARAPVLTCGDLRHARALLAQLEGY